MDRETAHKQFGELKKDLAAAYMVMTVTLALLPVPMRLPMRQADDPDLAIRSLDRAWELAELEPVDAGAVGHVRAMVTGWLTAYELAVAAQDSGPAPWRVRGIEAALGSCRQHSGWIRRYLKRVNNPRGPVP